MKIRFYLSLILMAMLPFMTACSSDSEDNSLSGGVYVSKQSKKLKSYAYKGQSDEKWIRYDLTYDNKGRLNTIATKNGNYTIDYENKVIRMGSDLAVAESFELNSNGFISKIIVKINNLYNNLNIVYNVNYDSNGYLTKIAPPDTEEGSFLATYSEYGYNNEDLITGYNRYNKMSYEYICDNNENIGNICIWDKGLTSYYEMFAILRMVGLFGKTSKHLVFRERQSNSYDSNVYYYHYNLDPDGYVTYAYRQREDLERKAYEVELSYY